jgi:predicted deacylase
METSIVETLNLLAPGARAHGRIPVGTLASGSEIGIPFVVLKGASDGPCLWLNGQVHGNEINGILAALDFANGLDPSALAGALVVTATANPLAFDARRKSAPHDDHDLDQSYPGREDGFTTERMAHALFAQARATASVLVNLHTLSPLFESKPYAVYKVRAGGPVSEEKLLSLIAPFRPAVACRMSLEAGVGELPGNVAGALDYQLSSLGIPAFMIELGAGSRAEPQYIAQGVSGFTGLAQRLGMLPGQADAPAQLRRVTRRSHVVFSHGGLFRARCQPGDSVRAGEPLGSVMDVWGKTVETMTLPYDHVVIAIRRDPVVHTGDRFAFVAQAWEQVAANTSAVR